MNNLVTGGAGFIGTHLIKKLLKNHETVVCVDNFYSSNKLNIEQKLPFVEILEIKKNKSFVAQKAKIFKEEKKISSNAPVTSVKISNISKNKTRKKNHSFVCQICFEKKTQKSKKSKEDFDFKSMLPLRIFDIFKSTSIY